MTVPAERTELREAVRGQYAAAAARGCCRTDADTCCGSDLITIDQKAFFGQAGHPADAHGWGHV